MERGLNLNTFLLFDLIYFQSNSFIVRLLGNHNFTYFYSELQLFLLIIDVNFFVQPQVEASFTQSWPVILKRN